MQCLQKGVKVDLQEFRMAAAVQCFLLDRPFWRNLPKVELEATATSHLRKHVSLDEIVTACERVDELTTLTYYDVTLVGVNTPDLVMPGVMEESIEDFVKANADYWVIIPKEGCTIVYDKDQLTESEAAAFPRLKELEKGRETDSRGLLFSITSALNLSRVSHDLRADFISYS